MADRPYILLVNDAEGMLQLYTVILERISHQDYEIATADDGLIALNMITERAPDLVITDTTMPNMDGRELFETVRDNPAWDGIGFILQGPFSRRRETLIDHPRLMHETLLDHPFEARELVEAVETRLAGTRKTSES